MRRSPIGEGSIFYYGIFLRINPLPNPPSQPQLLNATFFSYNTKMVKKAIIILISILAVVIFAPAVQAATSQPEIILIDGIGPFFVGYQPETVNWSKIPFAHWEQGNRLDWQRVDQRLLPEYRLFLDRIDQLPVTAITLDNVIHLAPAELVGDQFTALLGDYSQLYQQLFKLIDQRQRDIFITTDSAYQLPDQSPVTANGAAEFQAQAWRHIFETYPQVDGIILRIGETDAQDVTTPFPSHLAVRTPQQLNAYLQTVLPVIEEYDKTLILRNWVVGAYPIGDFNWNPETTRQALDGITSPNLILSTKPGASDFFRHSTLTPILDATDHPKIIELQPKREYEGFGQVPNFVGQHHTQIIAQTQDRPDVVGYSLWTTTGGWSNAGPVAYVEDGSFWTELNTRVTLDLLMGRTLMESITVVCEDLPDCQDVDQLSSVLTALENSIAYNWYIEPFASQDLFFRRVKIPPLAWIYWQDFSPDGLVAEFIQSQVDDVEAAITQSQQSLDELLAQQASWEELGLPSAEFELVAQLHTLLATAQQVVLDFSDQASEELQQQLDSFTTAYPGILQTNQVEVGSNLDRWLGRIDQILVRTSSEYRLIDRLMISSGVSWVWRQVVDVFEPLLPREGKAMELETVFR